MTRHPRATSAVIRAILVLLACAAPILAAGCQTTSPAPSEPDEPVAVQTEAAPVAPPARPKYTKPRAVATAAPTTPNPPPEDPAPASAGPVTGTTTGTPTNAPPSTAPAAAGGQTGSAGSGTADPCDGEVLLAFIRTVATDIPTGVKEVRVHKCQEGFARLWALPNSEPNAQAPAGDQFFLELRDGAWHVLARGLSIDCGDGRPELVEACAALD